MKHGGAIAVGTAVGGAALVVALASSSAHAAEVVAPGEQRRKGNPNANKAVPFVVRSPFNGVSDEKWRAYLKSMGDPGHQRKVSRRLQVGAFLFGYPRLAELGLARDLRRVDVEGKQVWAGSFAPPLTLERFLADPRLQVRAMDVSAQDHAPKIKSLYGSYADQVVEGQKPTISGLLAVAHRAGLKGLGSWLRNPADRKRYPNTTAAYRAANGIF